MKNFKINNKVVEQVEGKEDVVYGQLVDTYAMYKDYVVDCTQWISISRSIAY